jgi:hypothetical protein
MLARLTPIEREVLVRRMAAVVPVAVVALEAGASRQTVYQRCRRADEGTTDAQDYDLPISTVVTEIRHLWLNRLSHLEPLRPVVRDERRVIAVCAKGFDVEYVEISGQSNETVLEETRRCDFVVDQAFSDVPMAGFALEAAALGRPAVIGTLDAEQFNRWIPASDMPPVRACRPEALALAIEELVHDRTMREALGRRASDFVRHHRDAAAVAGRLARLATSDLPADWLVDPSEITYVMGCGSPQVVQDSICNCFDAAARRY